MGELWVFGVGLVRSGLEASFRLLLRLFLLILALSDFVQWTLDYHETNISFYRLQYIYLDDAEHSVIVAAVLF
jgi:hypothetical protein